MGPKENSALHLHRRVHLLALSYRIAFIGQRCFIVDSLSLWQMDILERQGSLFMGATSVSMETSVIMHNIQRIVKVHTEILKGFLRARTPKYVKESMWVFVLKELILEKWKCLCKLRVFFIFLFKENECLKREILEKSSCIEKQNCKITELISQNQRWVSACQLEIIANKILHTIY